MFFLRTYPASMLPLPPGFTAGRATRVGHTPGFTGQNGAPGRGIIVKPGVCPGEAPPPSVPGLPYISHSRQVGCLLRLRGGRMVDHIQTLSGRVVLSVGLVRMRVPPAAVLPQSCKCPVSLKGNVPAP